MIKFVEINIHISCQKYELNIKLKLRIDFIQLNESFGIHKIAGLFLTRGLSILKGQRNKKDTSEGSLSETTALLFSLLIVVGLICEKMNRKGLFGLWCRLNMRADLSTVSV